MSKITWKRRQFLAQAGVSSTGLILLGPGLLTSCATNAADRPFEPGELRISLAEWSLNVSLKAGDMDNLDFAGKASQMGFEAIEYVNQFFPDKANDKSYLDEMNLRAHDHGVKQLLIMIDHEGDLGSPDDAERNKAVQNHYKWVEAAKHLGCHSIRVNARGEGSSADVQKAAVDGLRRLTEFARPYDINVIVENHGGYSSHGQWLAGIIKQIDMDNSGTLPDFGNFCLEKKDDECVNEYDMYQGVRELMPYAKGVSAKSNDFNEEGHEVRIDFSRMIGIVRDAGYSGYIGVEYEGSRLSAEEGIIATKKLLERCI